MAVKKVYQDMQIYNPEILDITPEDIIAKFQATIRNMASISLASGYVTKPAVPHMIANAFKNLAAVTFDSEYSFPLADKLKEAAKNAPASGAPAAAGGKAAPVAEEKEKEEEEADVDMGGLFGDDY